MALLTMAFLHHARRRSTQSGSTHSTLTRSSLTRLSAGLALLAALASPAAAQTLNLQSGDAVTVTGTGTQGIYQGQPINNPTNSYMTTANFDDPVTVNSGSMFTLGNGGILTASGAGEALSEAAGNALITGGTISGQGSQCSGIHTTGGTLTISGGNIFGNFSALLTEVGSTTQIAGGTFTGGLYGDGLAIIGGNVHVSGGTFSGGNKALAVADGGVLDLFGTFNGYSSGSVITSGNGTITGTLLDGQAFSDTYLVNNTTPGSQIEFNVGTPPAAVPELSSAGSLGIGLAFLGMLGLAARKRGQQAAGQ